MSLPTTYKTAIVQDKPGVIKIEERPLPEPGKNQVLVKVEFAAINPSDVMNINHNYLVKDLPVPRPAGREGSGTVVAIGYDLQYPHEVGDKVHVIGLGMFSQYIMVESYFVTPIKNGLSFENAACHIANPLTVHYMGFLVKKQGVKAVIQTAASSALGRMAIRYFKHIGIKTINTVRQDKYIEELLKEGADYVINSEGADFETKLKNLSQKEEAIISFDAVAGTMTAKLLRNQPVGSTVYIYGFLEDVKLKDFEVKEFLIEGKTLTGLNTKFGYIDKLIKSGDFVSTLLEIQNLLPTIFKSDIQKIYELDDIAEAVEYSDKNGSQGKVLLKMH